jgi:hypothetical protein
LRILNLGRLKIHEAESMKNEIRGRRIDEVKVMDENIGAKWHFNIQ